MLELLKLAGTREQGIGLETRRRRSIPNVQAPESDQAGMRVFARLLTKHPGWVLRKPPCGVYNCFGHVWASRRTAIYEQATVEVILSDDGYRPVAAHEAPRCGDLAIYRWAGSDSILHAGVVSEIRGLAAADGGPASGVALAWVLSKWNDTTGEVLHHCRDVPWPDSDFELRFWTDRPEAAT